MKIKSVKRKIAKEKVKKPKKVRFSMKNIEHASQDEMVDDDSSNEIEFDKDGETVEDDQQPITKKNEKKKKKKKIDLEKDDEEDESSEEELDHKMSLDKLKKTDPEFYKFLQENDKNLLDFDDDDDEEEGEDEIDEELDEIDKEDEKKSQTIVTMKLINEWSEKLRNDFDLTVIRNVVKSLKAAVDQTSGESSCEFKVEDSNMFNAVINLCLVDLLPAIKKFLKLPLQTQNSEGKIIPAKKSKNWKKIGFIIRGYLIQILNILNVVSDVSILATLLHHTLDLIPFFISFSHLNRRLMKKMIEFWSEGEEKVRIISFLCILRISRNEEKFMLSFILKKLYFSYIKNCKFTTIDTWPSINFMMRSLIELYSLDHVVAYQHAFVFIKQLAIQLRNAMTIKKKESYKSVYNWQYLHSIRLWGNLVSSLNQSDVIKQLIYPLVQVIIGTIKLIPSAKYFPLRFHLTKILIKISDETGTFIPILPFLTEVFDHLDLSKKHHQSKGNAEFNFEVIIKVSQQTINDIKYKEAVINKLYELSFYYLSTQSFKIAFPELVQIPLIKIKKFIKTNHNVRHLQLIKQLCDKIDENSKFISEKRKNITFGINDTTAINVWESQRKEEKTPIQKFYEQWKKMRSSKEKHENIEENDQLKLDQLKLDQMVKSKDKNTDDLKDKEKRKKKKTIEKKKAKKLKNKLNKKAKKDSSPKKQLNKNNPTELVINEALDISSDEDQ